MIFVIPDDIRTITKPASYDPSCYFYIVEYHNVPLCTSMLPHPLYAGGFISKVFVHSYIFMLPPSF